MEKAKKRESLKKKKSIKSVEERRDLYLVILVILLGLILFFASRAFIHFNDFRQHRNYVKQPDHQIESWMTVQTIEMEYGIPSAIISQEFNIKDTRSVKKETLDTLCTKKHLNCTDVVRNLNSLRN